MNEFLKLPADKRRVIYEQVSLRMGINDAKAIEKDVWVTGILQCVFTLPYAHALVFKPKSVIRHWGDCPLVSCSMLLA